MKRPRYVGSDLYRARHGRAERRARPTRHGRIAWLREQLDALVEAGELVRFDALDGRPGPFYALPPPKRP